MLSKLSISQSVKRPDRLQWPSTPVHATMEDRSDETALKPADETALELATFITTDRLNIDVDTDMQTLFKAIKNFVVWISPTFNAHVTYSTATSPVIHVTIVHEEKAVAKDETMAIETTFLRARLETALQTLDQKVNAICKTVIDQDDHVPLDTRIEIVDGLHFERTKTEPRYVLADNELIPYCKSIVERRVFAYQVPGEHVFTHTDIYKYGLACTDPSDMGIDRLAYYVNPCIQTAYYYCVHVQFALPDYIIEVKSSLYLPEEKEQFKTLRRDIVASGKQLSLFGEIITEFKDYNPTTHQMTLTLKWTDINQEYTRTYKPYLERVNPAV